MATKRVYRCHACPTAFLNPIARATHARQEHPGLPMSAPKWLRGKAKVRTARGSLKRATDVWPGKP